MGDFWDRVVLTVLGALAILPLVLIGADSSVGEHLPYKQGVVGSNPIPPTKRTMKTSD